METAKIYPALIKAIAEIKNPPKDKQGYGYKYSDLATIIFEAKPILAKHGLMVVQLITGNQLNTRIIHDSGEFIESTCDLVPLNGSKMNDVQAMGATITYMRRYALSALLFIASDDDTDAADVKTTPITASEHGLSFSLEIINNTVTLEQLERNRLELGKKKWSQKDACVLKEAIDKKRKEFENVHN